MQRTDSSSNIRHAASRVECNRTPQNRTLPPLTARAYAGHPRDTTFHKAVRRGRSCAWTNRAWARAISPAAISQLRNLEKVALPWQAGRAGGGHSRVSLEHMQRSSTRRWHWRYSPAGGKGTPLSFSDACALREPLSQSRDPDPPGRLWIPEYGGVPAVGVSASAAKGATAERAMQAIVITVLVEGRRRRIWAFIGNLLS